MAQNEWEEAQSLWRRVSQARPGSANVESLRRCVEQLSWDPAMAAQLGPDLAEWKGQLERCETNEGEACEPLWRRAEEVRAKCRSRV